MGCEEWSTSFKTLLSIILSDSIIYFTNYSLALTLSIPSTVFNLILYVPYELIIYFGAHFSSSIVP